MTGDATLVSLLAYAGLRPGEALALRWKHIRENSIFVEQAVANGDLKSTKTGTVRSVALLDALRGDLDALRQMQTPLNDDQLLFATDARPWTESQWRNWRRRRFQPAATSAGVPAARPYDLRHSFVSLLIHEGRNVVDVAAQAGHAATLCLSTYAHLFAEGTAPAPGCAATAIQTARMAQRTITPG